MAKANGGITNWASEKDGSFKRTQSTFRDHIGPGGKFAPEKGELSEERSPFKNVADDLV